MRARPRRPRPTSASRAFYGRWTAWSPPPRSPTGARTCGGTSRGTSRPGSRPRSWPRASAISRRRAAGKSSRRAASSMRGAALGDPDVKEPFTPDARRRARDMVDHLVAALDDRLHTLEWMGDSTRAQAVGKLRAFGKKIGYPDKWRDYSKLVIDKHDFAGNLVRAQTFATARDLGRIDKPLDKAEWRMTAPTVNATYSPSFNDITFPADNLV